MKHSTKQQDLQQKLDLKLIEEMQQKSWERIAPNWPLQNIIACNPLQGFENLPFARTCLQNNCLDLQANLAESQATISKKYGHISQKFCEESRLKESQSGANRGFTNFSLKTGSSALEKGSKFFEEQNLPKKLEEVNRISIKWCQSFFDSGQATIAMPNREQGFFKSWLKLAIFDDEIRHSSSKNRGEEGDFLKTLSTNASEAILEILQKLGLKEELLEDFLTFLLSSLAGWSAYVRYLGDWSYEKNPEIKNDFLAVRLAITLAIWPSAAEELTDFLKSSQEEGVQKIDKIIEEITANESDHRNFLLRETRKNYDFLKLSQENLAQNRHAAQLVFCIDVRSEPIRRAIEQCGNYETFGFAGFFGIAASIANDLNQEIYASCPVLLTPKHKVIEKMTSCDPRNSRTLRGHFALQEIKKFYQSLKYNFSTPVPLAEGMGIWSGLWMLIKTFSPKSSKFLQVFLQKFFGQNFATSPEISSIPFDQQCAYGLNFLRAIGLARDFSKLVVLCGHGSQTKNNSFATALDCGACGGRHGDSNAKILSKILNQAAIRDYLRQNGIDIASDVRFIAAKHNTTTDEIELYLQEEAEGSLFKDGLNAEIVELQKDLTRAKIFNNKVRALQMGMAVKSEEKLGESFKTDYDKFFFARSHSWCETQPEWGLAKNASFIVAPRDLTKNIDLAGRSFLHSYDWRLDSDGSILHLILNAPLVVAQWINSQYLFSTLNNSAFGAGSKITQNIVGKIGVMQGNGSDLMHGLPLQSVFESDQKNYHLPARLAALIYAPQDKLDRALAQSPKIQELVKNEWIKIYCLAPENGKILELLADLKWSQVAQDSV